MSFLDGESYSAADLNEITSRIVTNGVADRFSDGVPDNVSHLNNLITDVVGAGVVPADDTSLKIVMNSGDYYIRPGVGFFGNGITVEVISAEQITPIQGEKTYVSFVCNTINNTVDINVSTSAPSTTDENIIILGEIDAQGNITDRRKYATGKIVGYQNNFNSLKKQTITHAINGYTNVDVIQTLPTKDLKFLVIQTTFSLSIVSFDENLETTTYNYSSSYRGTQTGKLMAGRTSKGSNLMWVNITKVSDYNFKFHYTIYTGSSRSDNDYGTITYTIYYV